MKNLGLVAFFVAFTLTACLVSPGPPGYGGITISPLPEVVELDAESHYYRDSYYYYYQNNDWRYSKSRSGPWTRLPRLDWPKRSDTGAGMIETAAGVMIVAETMIETGTGTIFMAEIASRITTGDRSSLDKPGTITA
jgi:hypothetical protein